MKLYLDPPFPFQARDPHLQSDMRDWWFYARRRLAVAAHIQGQNQGYQKSHGAGRPPGALPHIDFCRSGSEGPPYGRGFHPSFGDGYGGPSHGAMYSYGGYSAAPMYAYAPAYASQMSGQIKPTRVVHGAGYDHEAHHPALRVSSEEWRRGNDGTVTGGTSGLGWTTRAAELEPDTKRRRG